MLSFLRHQTYCLVLSVLRHQTSSDWNKVPFRVMSLILQKVKHFPLLCSKPGSEHISDLGGFARTRMIAVLSRYWASRYLWDPRLFWEGPVKGKWGALVGIVFNVHMKEERLLENETMGPGSAHRGHGNHWSETDRVMFMQKWFKRSETLFCSLYGIVFSYFWEQNQWTRWFNST